MTSSELRNLFLDFFKNKGHAIVSSSSLLPTDPSVLFTTAGMQQFKEYYLAGTSPYGRNIVGNPSSHILMGAFKKVDVYFVLNVITTKLINPSPGKQK